MYLYVSVSGTRVGSLNWHLFLGTFALLARSHVTIHSWWRVTRSSRCVWCMSHFLGVESSGRWRHVYSIVIFMTMINTFRLISKQASKAFRMYIYLCSRVHCDMGNTDFTCFPVDGSTKLRRCAYRHRGDAQC